MKLLLKKKREPTIHGLTVKAILLITSLFFWLVPGKLCALGADDVKTASGEGSMEGTVVTFTNTKNTTPDLYVTKSILTSFNDETDYSDVEFTFTLLLDGTVARQIEYTVWDVNGNQVFLYEDGESTEEKSNAIAYRTSRYGVFTLKSGQTARFSNLSAGTSYEVAEDSMEGFTQVIPSGGANAAGTIASEGSVAAFTNLATKGTDSGKSGIKIYKTVSFPDGWTLPYSPAFSFVITVNGEELVLEDYEVYDSDTGILKEIRTTDAEGIFSLYAGECALFETETNMDYTIAEIETEGWRTTTDEMVSGSTDESIQTVVFNNASASFLVTKTLVGETEETAMGEAGNEETETETEFTFLLSDASGTALAGVSYWLYDIYGNPQYNDDGEILSYITGADGGFNLKAGQAAVFYGVETGTQYSVSEVPVKGWKQAVPSSVTGYTGKIVSDAVEILPFENEAVDLNGMLTVTKLVETASALLAPTDDEFTFCLSDGGGDPVSGAVYSISVGGEEFTFKTDEAGTFVLHAGETAVFPFLPFGTYSVKEISVPWRTHDAYVFSSLTVIDGTESRTCEEDGMSGELDEDGLTFEYTNIYTAPSSITIYKYQNDGTTYLSGVTFTLADDDGKVLLEQTTGEDGKAYFGSLNAGTYTITETSTQDGYTILLNSFTVTVPLTMTKDEVKTAGTDTSDAVWRADTNRWYFFDVTYNITNSAVLDLPETGGNGWFISVIFGAATLVSVVILFLYHRKREKGAG